MTPLAFEDWPTWPPILQGETDVPAPPAVEQQDTRRRPSPPAPRPAPKHGYVAYTHGCRCDICREAKATYQRERRRALKAGGSVPRTAQHGLRTTYVEYGCRCSHCRRASAAANRRWYAAKRSDAVPPAPS